MTTTAPTETPGGHAAAMRHLEELLCDYPVRSEYGSKLYDQCKAAIEALRAALQASDAAVEPALHQYRMRPTWKPDEEGWWSSWAPCSRDAYEDYIKTPLLHDWHYEVRRLYTAPPLPAQVQEAELRKHIAAHGAAAVPSAVEALHALIAAEERFVGESGVALDDPVADAVRVGKLALASSTPVPEMAGGVTEHISQFLPHEERDAWKAFSTAMARKLYDKYLQGYSGFDSCTAERLSTMLHEHVAKGDPVDVANFCMFLYANGQRIVAAPHPSPAPQAAGAVSPSQLLPLPQPKRFFGHSTMMPMWSTEEMQEYAAAHLAANSLVTSAAFDDGWRLCAKWARRDDLLADMDSAAFKDARAICIAIASTATGRAGS